MPRKSKLNAKEVVSIYCTNSSLRGVPKLAKHKHISLRILWTLFIILMVIFLGLSVFSLVMTYREYSTIMNTSQGYEDIGSFPSVTFCNRYPFGSKASEIWDKNEIKSPKNYSQTLREKISHMLSSHDIWHAQKIYLQDQLTAYYETIGVENATKLGHNKDVLKYCILGLKKGSRMGRGEECGVKITLFRHHHYFNCFTVTVKPEHTHLVVTLGLVIQLHEESYDSQHIQWSHIQDIFSPSHGVRLVLHELDTYPDLERYGKNVESNKFSELVFEVHKFDKANTPQHKCLSQSEVEALYSKNFKVDGFEYRYTFDRCQESSFAEILYKKCHCISAQYRLDDSFVVNKSYPFCHEMRFDQFNDTLERIECFHEVYHHNITSVNKESSKASCGHRCIFYTYKSDTSTSKWSPLNWQIYWLMKMSDSWKILRKATKYSAVYNRTIKLINNYTQLGKISYAAEIDLKRSTFITIRRPNFETLHNVETLGITLSSLMSSIGGISSLTIGITFSALFELVEFLYLCWIQRKINVDSQND